MHATYVENCVVHACNLARLLLDAGETPWIGGIRETVMMGDARLHQALIPVRFAGRASPAWTTHYVCCSGTVAYDPLVGAPIDIDELSAAIFGRPLPVTKAISEAQVSELAKRGDLHALAITSIALDLRAE